MSERKLITLLEVLLTPIYNSTAVRSPLLVGKLFVDSLEIDNMVMYVTEELLYRDEKFISREDEMELLLITIMSS